MGIWFSDQGWIFRFGSGAITIDLCKKGLAQ